MPTSMPHRAFIAAALYPSPLASSMTASAVLLPVGGLTSTTTTAVGLGQIPRYTYTQLSRPAVSHAILVQTPHVQVNVLQHIEAV